MILNELYNNSIKYAFDSISKGIIEIELKSTNDSIYFNYSDNGKGFIPFENLTDGLGLKVIQQLCIQHSFQWKFDTQNGVYSEISFLK